MQGSELHDLVRDLGLHWTSPCATCNHEGRNTTHAARVEAMERLIVGGWLDPARRWPIQVPEFLKPMIGEAVQDGAR